MRQRRTDRSGAVEHLHQARREVRLRHPGQQARRRRRVFRRLEQHGVAEHQRRRQLAQGCHDREVPGAQRRDHAARSPQHHVAETGARGRHHRAVVARRQAHHLARLEHALVELAAGLGQRLALLEHDGARDLLAPRHQVVEPAQHRLAALQRGQLAPLALGAAGGLDGGIDLARAGGGVAAHHLVRVGRVAGLEPTGFAIHPGAADQHAALAREGRGLGSSVGEGWSGVLGRHGITLEHPVGRSYYRPYVWMTR
jgi:hypothetical protein